MMGDVVGMYNLMSTCISAKGASMHLVRDLCWNMIIAVFISWNKRYLISYMFS